MVLYFLLCFTGKLCIYLLQKFPFHKLPIIQKLFVDGGFLHDLFACDLCLGVWVFAFLSYMFGVNLLEDIFYLPMVSEFITGGITSFVVHLLCIGFMSKFGVIEVR